MATGRTITKQDAFPATAHTAAFKQPLSAFQRITPAAVRIAPIALFFLFHTLAVLHTAAAQQSKVAETPPADIPPLQIGDTLPEVLWHLPLQTVNHPEGKDTITLNDYRGKLIILDFWATWCLPCIKNLPKLHTLQNEFGEKIKVLAVTQEDTNIISKFFTTGAGKKLAYVVSVHKATKRGQTWQGRIFFRSWLPGRIQCDHFFAVLSFCLIIFLFTLFY